MRAGALIMLLIPALAATADVDEASGLIVNPGWEQVRANCGGCHSHALVTAQRADRKTWLESKGDLATIEV